MLISFEGIDGTGKATQAGLLTNYLKSIGINSVYFDFPAYESFVGKEVGRLLSSNTADKTYNALTIPPKLMAMLFTLDRMQFYKKITEAINAKQVVITNRYTLSNSVYQSIRADKDISKWVDQLEHEALGLPRPDCYIILLGSVSSSKELVAIKGVRNYTESHDIYEKNEELLKRSQELYCNISTPYSEKIKINCMSNSSFRTREDIHNEIITNMMPIMKKLYPQQEKINGLTHVINIFDRVWNECRIGYCIQFDQVEHFLKSLTREEYSSLNNIFVKNRTLDIFSHIINKVHEKNKTAMPSERHDLCIFVAAISYASNVINDMVHYPYEIREKICQDICSTFNIERADIVNLDKEWGKMFYSI